MVRSMKETVEGRKRTADGQWDSDSEHCACTHGRLPSYLFPRRRSPDISPNIMQILPQHRSQPANTAGDGCDYGTQGDESISRDEGVNRPQANWSPHYDIALQRSRTYTSCSRVGQEQLEESESRMQVLYMYISRSG